MYCAGNRYGQSPPEGDNDKDRKMENDVENRESSDTDGQSRPEGDEDMLRARNEMEDNQVSESLVQPRPYHRQKVSKEHQSLSIYTEEEGTASKNISVSLGSSFVERTE